MRRVAQVLLLAATFACQACSGESDATTSNHADSGSQLDAGGDATSDAGDAEAADGPSADATADAQPDTASVDLDGDGLDDALELDLAKAYFPYYSVDPADKCPLHGVVFRLSPHPDNANWLAVWYVVLFEHDCGANGHVGDDEVFGTVIDPQKPPPEGLLAVRAIAHQATLCSNTTTCGSLPGCQPCTLAGTGPQARPVVFASVNKHGGYVKEQTCDLNIICDFGGCSLNPAASQPPFVNAGEQAQPLVTDLSKDGFIQPALGWTETSLYGFNPWGGQEFGTAGSVTDDLTDNAFLVPQAGCQ